MTHKETTNDNVHFPQNLSCDEIIRLARNIITSRFHRIDKLTSANQAKDFLQAQIGLLEHEVFCAIFMDAQHRVICFEKLFTGSVSGATVFPREVVKRALEHNASAVIFAHNHPSGVCEPSNADHQITGRLKDALSLFEVQVLDHIIVSGEDIKSMAELGSF